jgi:hypothetical protein
MARATPSAAGCQLDLGAEQRQHLAPLDRHAVRHGEDEVIALGGADKSEADAGIPRGGLDQHRRRLKAPVALRRLDHRHGNAVFHGVERVEEFAFPQDLRRDVGARRDLLQPHQRRRTDGLEDAVVNVTAELNPSGRCRHGGSSEEKDALRLYPQSPTLGHCVGTRHPFLAVGGAVVSNSAKYLILSCPHMRLRN